MGVIYILIICQDAIILVVLAYTFCQDHVILIMLAIMLFTYKLCVESLLFL